MGLFWGKMLNLTPAVLSSPYMGCNPWTVVKLKSMSLLYPSHLYILSSSIELYKLECVSGIITNVNKMHSERAKRSTPCDQSLK